MQKVKKNTSSSPWITLAILSSLGIIATSAETMVLPAIPDFIKELTISYEDSSWILAALLVMGAVMTPIAGKLSDIYGKKKIVLIILGVSRIYKPVDTMYLHQLKQDVPHIFLQDLI